MDYEGLIDDNRVLIARSMNYETAVTFTYGHFNKVVFAVYKTWLLKLKTCWMPKCVTDNLAKKACKKVMLKFFGKVNPFCQLITSTVSSDCC